MISAMKKRQPIITYIILALSASGLAFFSTDIYLPFIEIMAKVMHGTILQIQASVAVFMAALAASNLFATSLADRYGRKPILLSGSICALIGTLLLLIPSMKTFMCGRILQGLGAATGLGLSRAIIRDIATTPQHFSKLYSSYSAILCLAPAISSLLGAYLQHHLGWHSVFTSMLFQIAF